MPGTRGYMPSARAAALLLRRQRQAQLDERVRPYLEQALHVGVGCAAAARFLEQAGIPSPQGKPHWSRTAIWRTAKRLGIRIAQPGLGIGTNGIMQKQTRKVLS